MSREEEHHTKCHPLPSVSAQLWHLRTHRTLSVVNRTYSRKGAVPQGKNGTKTGLCCCLQMWTALILQSLSLKKNPNKKPSGIVPLAFHSSQPAEKSQKLLQFITLCLGRVLCFFFFFFLNWGSVFQYSNFYKVFPACHQSPSSFMMFLTDGELTKHVSSLLQCKMLKATSMTY